MYKHNASSIKENDQRMFVSDKEKNQFDGYDKTKRRIDDTYTSSEVDSIMIDNLSNTRVNISSEDGNIIILDNKHKGFADILNVKGKTLQDNQTLSISAVGRKVADNQYSLSLKSMNAGNLLDLSDKPFVENGIRVLYNHTYNGTIIERYGEKGLKLIAKEQTERGCGFIRIPDYPVDLYVKVDVIGRGCVSLKTLDHVSDFYSGSVTNKTVRFTIPANSGLRKIELDVGNNSDKTVTYDNIIISTFEHKDDNHWEEYKEDKIDIMSPIQLHGGYRLNNWSQTDPTYDELCVIDNKLCIKQRMKTVKLNDIIDNVRIQNLGVMDETFERFNVIVEENVIAEKGYNANGYRHLLSVCDKLPATNNINNLHEFIKAEASTHNNSVYLLAKVAQTTLSKYDGNNNLDKFKKYIKQLDATVTYESYGTEIVELCDLEDLSLQLFENTVIDIDSSIKPSEITISTPTNFGSTMVENISELEMLEKEISNLNSISEEAVLNVKMNSNIIDLESTPGFIDEVTVNGKTYVNIFPSFDKMFVAYDNNITFGRNDDGSIYWEAIEAPAHHQFVHISAKHLRALKPNTEYTVVAKVRENTTSTFMLCDSGDSSGGVIGDYIFSKHVYISNRATGIVSGTSVTRSDIDTVDRRYSIYLGKNVTGKIVIDKIMMYEGKLTKDEIYMLANQPTIHSVGDSEPLKLTSKSSNNLFDGEYVHGYLGDHSGEIQGGDHINRAISSKSYIPCEPNVNYHLNIDLPNDKRVGAQLGVYFYGNNRDYLGHGKVAYLSTNVMGAMSQVNGYTFTTPENAKFLRFRIYNDDTTQVYDTNYKTILSKSMKNSMDYEYRTNSVYVDLTKYGIEGGLKSLPDGKRDRIFKKNGKYYIEQVAGYVKLTGDIEDQRWYVSSLNSQFKNVQCFIYRVSENADFLPPYIESTKVVSNLYSNILPAVAPGNTQIANGIDELHGVSVYDKQSNELRITVRKSDLSSLNLAGFKKWLDDRGGLEVVYQLAEPRIIEIEEDLDLLLYENESEISIESGNVIPEVTFKSSRYIQSAVNSMIEKVNEIEKKQVEQIKLLLESTYSSDFSLHKTMLMSARGKVNDIDEDLISIIKLYISSNQFDREELEKYIDLFTLIDKIDFDSSMELFEMISSLRDEEIVEI